MRTNGGIHMTESAGMSRIEVFPWNGYWSLKVTAPNALMPGTWLQVTQGCLPSEDVARSAAEHFARFYDEQEAARVGLPLAPKNES